MSGTLQASVVKDGASATNNLAMDASGNVTVGNNLSVTGTSSHTGNATFSGTITGSSTITAAAGTLYPVVSGTAQASTSGTSITFTGIPSWVKRITVMFNGVSTNGTSIVQVQVGSGSVTTTGYLGAVTQSTASNTPTGANFSAGFQIDQAANAAAIRYGQIVLALISGNTWTESGAVGRSDSATNAVSNGVIALSGALDRVVITTVNGTDTFDAGSINILYE